VADYLAADDIVPKWVLSYIDTSLFYYFLIIVSNMYSTTLM